MIAKFRSRWKDKVKRLEITGLFVLLIGLFVLITTIILGYVFNWNWTGLGPFKPPHPYESSFQRGKTLWDWMQLLIIPIVLAVAGYLFNLSTSRTERGITTDNQREAALQQYIDKMSELLLNSDLRKSQLEDEVRKIARVRTLTVLPRLDPVRKRSVLQFLYESNLIEHDIIKHHLPIIDLDDANLRGADLRGAALSGADLQGANMSDADLSGADLSVANLGVANMSRANLHGADLRGAALSGADLRDADLRDADLLFADLSGANMSRANMSGADLGRADLSDANLRGANLRGADLRGADLRDADLRDVTISTNELNKAKSLQRATMPDKSIHP